MVVENGSAELEYIIGPGRTNWALSKNGANVTWVERKGYIYGGSVTSAIDGDPDTDVWLRADGKMTIEVTLPKEKDIVKIAVKSKATYMSFIYDIYIYNNTNQTYTLIGTGSGDREFIFDPIKSERIKLDMHITQ